ncbi:MAG: carboxylating nicotinate-nucleotide diphosphorylase [Hyphomicrobiales bacterium]|nr:carboxylating nicotinate-nucleotide diphosphorylase [Hyphomicrobiales bacterium]
MSRSATPTLPRLLLEPVVRNALKEDFGRIGDITTNALVSPDATARARLVARESGIIAGMDAAMLAFQLLDADLSVEAVCAEGAAVDAGGLVLRIEGNARAMLAAERTALDFLARLSGIATATARAVEAVKGTGARISCTRKTTPGLRVLEKYAVRVGGGVNHRFGLDDAILIKDNHLALRSGDKNGAIASAVRDAQAAAGHMVAIEVEVDGLEQLEEALQAGATKILLDNMDVEELKRAVEITRSRAILEASGGINPARAGEVARTGVDVISIGALTHSSSALDVSLDVEPQR